MSLNDTKIETVTATEMADNFMESEVGIGSCRSRSVDDADSLSRKLSQGGKKSAVLR